MLTAFSDYGKENSAQISQVKTDQNIWNLIVELYGSSSLV